MNYIWHIWKTQRVLEKIDSDSVEKMVDILVETKSKAGRIFPGSRGSAANASHAVNDFRKICGMEAYAPTDNVSELTARTNDDGGNRFLKNGSKVLVSELGLCFCVFRRWWES